MRWPERLELTLLGLIAAAGVTGCSGGADVTSDELSVVLARHAVVFDG